MGMQHSTCVFYGVLVAIHDSDVEEQNTWEVLNLLAEHVGDDTEMVAENVRYFTCGNYDRNNLYLTIDQTRGASFEIKPGEYRTLGLGDDGDTASWSVQLYTAADDLGLEVLEGPCWFVVPDVS